MTSDTKEKYKFLYCKFLEAYTVSIVKRKFLHCFSEKKNENVSPTHITRIQGKVNHKETGIRKNTKQFTGICRMERNIISNVWNSLEETGMLDIGQGRSCFTTAVEYRYLMITDRRNTTHYFLRL